MDASVNLLPNDMQRRAIRFQVIRRWCPLLLFCSVAVFINGHRRWVACDRLSAEVHAAGKQTEDAQDLLLDVQQLEQRVGVLTTQLDRLQQLQPSPDPMALMFAVGRAAELSQDRLVLSGLQVTNDTVVVEAPVTSKSQNAEAGTTEHDKTEELVTRLDLNGRAVNDLAVARFVTGLRDDSMFDSVRLVSSLPTRSNSPLQREFIVECIRRKSLR